MGKENESYIVMETETQENNNSFGSKAKSFFAQFFLFLVFAGLVFALVMQLIIISAATDVVAN